MNDRCGCLCTESPVFTCFHQDNSYPDDSTATSLQVTSCQALSSSKQHGCSGVRPVVQTLPSTVLWEKPQDGSDIHQDVLLPRNSDPAALSLLFQPGHLRPSYHTPVGTTTLMDRRSFYLCIWFPNHLPPTSRGSGNLQLQCFNSWADLKTETQRPALPRQLDSRVRRDARPSTGIHLSRLCQLQKPKNGRSLSTRDYIYLMYGSRCWLINLSILSGKCCDCTWYYFSH